MASLLLKTTLFFLNLWIAASTAHTIQKRAASTNPGPNGWTFVGCYSDQNPRTLTIGKTSTVPGGAASMTVALCAAACNGYKYAGLEYAQECWCGNAISNGGALQTSGCSMACKGNTTEYCGGNNRLNIYQFGVIVSSSSSSSMSSTSSSSSSTVSSSSSSSLSSSVSSSISSSPSSSLSSSTSSSSSSQKLPSSSSVTSSASSTDSSAISSSTSSISSSVSSLISSSTTDSSATSSSVSSTISTSSTSSPISSSSSSMTSSASTSSSSTFSSSSSTSSSSVSSTSSSSISSGTDSSSTSGTSSTASSSSSIVSSSSESSSSSSTSSTASPSSSSSTTSSASSTSSPSSSSSSSTSSSASSTSSPSSSSTSVSSTSSSSVSSSSTSSMSSTTSFSSSSSSSATSSSSSSSTSSAASGLPSGWSYKGCYVDNANGRILLKGISTESTMTVDKCVGLCQSAGYSVAGIEYSTQCYCDNAVINGGALAKSDSECNMACGGNPAQKCGAGNRMSIYANGTLKTFDVPVPQKTNLPGKWEYKGCISEGAGQRIWQYQTILSNNSATECLKRCSDFGYMAGGMEYGTECFCGDVVDIENNGGLVKPESDCKTTCPGDARYYCGGGSRLTWYSWSLTDPLYKWNYPSGNNAGNYKLLIGGVVVPLITTLGVNGKVTFLEKHGTGAANSTGAYELDPSQVDNFSGAWRTMKGLKTDVFCSAGLTLPDKVGRQINIGGWAGTSLFGVRTYWPDGSPGNASKNDWQEDAANVKLQTGRWYPSAVQMSNGSILVMGGEQCSNCAPVPNMELLPKAGGLVDLDFLRRTDPFNLYPFLMVMPSGGIFVGYYNEARILDPVTFDTVRTLPQIPGNVNNPNAGRTYPLEGAAMIMPQKAPYTEPVTMLICGGSTSGAALVNDNCVSIQPENPASSWTIERMPSQRVMPCIAALPDGTYLIANGAKKGVAGFGLANTPNLNAILYDPSKPVNQRMSIMANTTVARLYHSEAITLQDGRVLISGSDPQDGKNPEEYRVEVFEPPYALSGLPKPAYTITNVDWSYSQQVSISITAGSTGNMRASLLGAVSSTHGNSMGQRTIFPAFSCAGSTCTVTGPPDNKVCPPGWYQLFILDGPTPSMSTWVRIGGDPASIGNWPPSAAFSKPGIGPVGS